MSHLNQELSRFEEEEKPETGAEAFGAAGPMAVSGTRYKTGLCNAFIDTCASELRLAKKEQEQINAIQPVAASARAGAALPTGLVNGAQSDDATEEAMNRLFCPSQEKFHTFVSRGPRNISEAP